MGNPVRSNAAVDDIQKDVRTAYDNAKARGGVALSLADETILPVIKVGDGVAAQIKATTDAAGPVLAALDAANDHADDLFMKVADDIFNAVGRPASDPYLSILLPGGSSYYVDGDVSEQPDKMLLFVELLKSGVHPLLPQADADAAAGTVEAESGVLRAAVVAAQPVRTKLQLLNRVYASLARVAALQLASYKRLLKGKGFSEADVHKIIPDRPRSEGKAAAKTDAKAPPADPAPASPAPGAPTAGNTP